MTEEVNPLSNMIDYITQSEFEKANNIFNEILGQRVSDSLDQEKIAVAQGIYSSEEEDLDDEETEGDEDDIEFTDEDLEDALEDFYDDEDDEN